VGILDRISTLVKSNINDALDRAEDPEKIIRQLLLNMNNQLIQVKTQVAAAIAQERNLRTNYEKAQTEAAGWQRRAELAVDQGRDDLAKEALQRYSSHSQAASGLEEQWKAQNAQVQALKDGLHQLEMKIEEARAKETLLIARSKSAKAQEQMHRTLGSIQSVGGVSEFERMERRVQEQEARAQAYTDLSTDTLDDKFAALETESDVDRQLRELKAKRQQNQLPSGGA